jgi:transposase
VTAGQRNDAAAAPALIAQVKPLCLLGDKAYDTNAIRAQLEALGATAALSSNENRVRRLPLDRDLYKERHAVECTINLLKRLRRFATRYEKTLRNYAAVVAIACALCWLRI